MSITSLRTTPCFALLVLAAIAAAPALAGDRPFASPGEPHAVVTGISNLPGRELYSVRIVRVDDTSIDGTSRERGVWLKPGRYRINAKANTVDPGLSGGLTRSVGRDTKREGNAIELEVEAGKTYWIALDTSADRRTDWKLVNWRVEDRDD